MRVRGKITDLNDLLLPLGKRPSGCVYFCRINGYSERIGSFIETIYPTAKRSGAVIEGGVPNPTQGNLEYYNEMLGDAYREDAAFISSALAKWLPRLTPAQNKSAADAVCSALGSLKADGKNENIRKSTYVKFMCWLYYKFEPVVRNIGGEDCPKILYEGNITRHELMLMSALCGCGCDVILLQYSGDAGYLKLDPQSKYSEALTLPGMGAFPQGYCIAKVRGAAAEKQRMSRISGGVSAPEVITNETCSEKKPLDDILKAPASRGTDGKVRNYYFLLKGTDDKIGYTKKLYDFRNTLINGGRAAVVVNGHIPLPDPAEISGIKRGEHGSPEQLVSGLAVNMSFIGANETRAAVTQAFARTLTAAASAEPNINRLESKAVYLLCWLKRMHGELFGKGKPMGCFIFLGKDITPAEELYIRFLAACPTDVLLIQPDLNGGINVNDPKLRIYAFPESLELAEFPTNVNNTRIGTVAYHAERELDTLMYTDSGMYRDRQFAKAKTVILETMCEEIPIIWNTDLKYRAGFSSEGGTVTVPALFAKVSGIKNGNTGEYWRQIKKLINNDTIVIKQAPYILDNTPNPIMQYAVRFVRDGRLKRGEIKSCPAYQYGFLREELQEHILDKIQLLLDSGTIRDTFKGGREYLIIATCLAMSKEIVRQIQSFDFAKKNPKLIYIITGETPISLADSIVTLLLSYIGFDVVYYVPTGYRSVEQYFTTVPFLEHQAGEYVYDLTVPDFNSILLTEPKKGFFEGLFGRK